MRACVCVCEWCAEAYSALLALLADLAHLHVELPGQRSHVRLWSIAALSDIAYMC